MFGNADFLGQGVPSEIHGVVAENDAVDIEEGKQVEVEVFHQKGLLFGLEGD